MAQTVVLAAGTTTANSSTITLTTAPAPVTVYLFSSSTLPKSVQCPVYLNGPSSTVVFVGNLSQATPILTLTSPGSYYVARSVNNLDNTAVGIAIEQ